MLAVSLSEGITEENLQRVYSDPFIARAGHDHRPFAPIHHPQAQYLSAFVGGKFAGAFLVIRTTALNLDLHVLLFRDSVKHSRALGRACLRWAFSQEDVQRVTAPVVADLQSVVNYCLKLGFSKEGFCHCSVVRGGHLQGIHIMGMTRKDWSTKWDL